MKIAIISLVLLTAFSFASAITGPHQAANLVFNDILEGEIEGKSVLSFERILTAGETIGTWHEDIIVPVTGYLVLIDDAAYANWEHPCRWVFVSTEGEMVIIKLMTPPNALPRMVTEYTCLPTAADSKDQYEEFLAWFTPNVQSSPENAENMYAWIISGGYNMANNHIRYYGDVQFLYNVLHHDYLIPDNHIIVCFADGIDPTPDQYGGLNSNPDFDDDGDFDITYDATHSGIISGFDDIKAMLGADDHLLIFTTDHGGEGKFDSPPEVHLNLWNTESLYDDDLQVMLSELTAYSVHAAMEQCYSGGFLEEVLTGTTAMPSSFTSAANGYEYSWAGATYPEYDEWAYYWTGAMHGTIPPTTSLPGGPLPGNPDMNSDGVVSFWEAADRALAWDTSDEHPQWDDDPDSCGEQYYLGGRITVGIEDGDTPIIPSTGNLFLLSNPVLSVSTLMFSTDSPSGVEISVYDMAGHVIETLLSEDLPAGEHTLVWNTEHLASGVYLVRFRADDVVESIRAVKL
ncbi:MAG: T9SS type A sorting domain-containing protein [Candidatus Fermentibacteraceae bacterium]|nr:T9SS type A sorting domain-containing protein [Candidatus Fermentibacteraceae bacterium]